MVHKSIQAKQLEGQTIIITRAAQPGLQQRALPIIQQWGGGGGGGGLHWETTLLASDLQLLSTSKAVPGSGELSVYTTSSLSIVRLCRVAVGIH